MAARVGGKASPARVTKFVSSLGEWRLEQSVQQDVPSTFWLMSPASYDKIIIPPDQECQGRSDRSRLRHLEDPGGGERTHSAEVCSLRPCSGWNTWFRAPSVWDEPTVRGRGTLTGHGDPALKSKARSPSGGTLTGRRESAGDKCILSGMTSPARQALACLPADRLPTT
jgi:hypothetical protein